MNVMFLLVWFKLILLGIVAMVSFLRVIIQKQEKGVRVTASAQTRSGVTVQRNFQTKFRKTSTPRNLISF